ncbi:MAG: AAA family ATPase [Cyanobacteriota bacterium]|nr:AAA family ATPase [Cyanobacteriota bacterium]
MYKTIEIYNFRGFQSFKLENIGRLNLLVGVNNSGKTSILEAIQLLSSKSDLKPILEILERRGEYLVSEDFSANPHLEIEFDICHFFHTHKLEGGSKFLISGLKQEIQEKFEALIDFSAMTIESIYFNQDIKNEDSKLDKVPKFINKWTVDDEIVNLLHLPLSPNNGISEQYRRISRRDVKEKNSSVRFITSSSLDTKLTVDLFDRIVLTENETLIYEALQTIEPKLERIASVALNQYGYREPSRGGFVVRLSDSDRRVPIGSLGDGIWRMLGLALAIANVKNGILLVDEIDTGLHFTVMADMWKLIWETAKRLNVQVFATTHNSDCWTSLASIASREDVSEDGITIHRIERDKNTSIVFSEREIAIAAERGIEVR